MTKEDFSLKPLLDAAKLLRFAVEATKDDLTRDGAIQRFEYTFELSWKTLKRYLELHTNFRDDNIRNILREAGDQGLIHSVEEWFDFQEARNLSSHTYSGNVAATVFAKAAVFVKAVDFLIQKLENLVGNPNLKK